MPDNNDDNNTDRTPDINNNFEPIKPTDIQLTQAPKPAANTEPADGFSIGSSSTESDSAEFESSDLKNIGINNPSRRWIYIAILVAVACVLLLLVITVFDPRSTDSKTRLTTAEQSTATPLLEKSPFEKAQLAAARRTAQDILARVLAKQQTLEAINIQQWADEEYQQALAVAAEGDKLYREREFKAAIEHYASAETQLDKLEAEREPRIDLLLTQGLAAINQGQAELAEQAFDQVLLIDPNHPQALQGKQRGTSLPDVFAATERGKALQINGDYAAALTEYTQALNLDPLFEAALAGQEEAQKLLSDEQFQAAINRGFQHLHSGELSTARKHFTQALRIKPQSAVAQSALAQVDNEIAQRAIARLLNKAQHAESKEQWQAALDTYNKILARDSAVTAATVGKIRSTARAQLDTKLETFIHQPLRLASPAVFREAQQNLADAQQISQGGQRLKQQINSLRQILVNAQKPQTVVLRSDNLTRVSIFKLGEFPPFTEKTLQLKPGKYIAEGIRSGYRDVRVEFTVLGANTAPVVVQCGETI
ncbi:hypothetical protein A9Q88_11485 [Gammaproteobacteria bacterium 50_400_T64]|nr:hypothetical protein A9Q88_11485 [Gammaproteobacteria bacterium 50_400_T64]